MPNGSKVSAIYSTMLPGFNNDANLGRKAHARHARCKLIGTPVRTGPFSLLLSLISLPHMQMLEIVVDTTGKDVRGSLFPLESILFKWKPTDDDASVAKVVLDFTG